MTKITFCREEIYSMERDGAEAVLDGDGDD